MPIIFFNYIFNGLNNKYFNFTLYILELNIIKKQTISLTFQFANILFK